MLRKNWLWIVVAVLAVLVLAACGAEQESNDENSAQQGEDNGESSDGAEPSEEETSSVRIGTTSVGSVYYTLSIGISEILENHTDINSTVEAVGGTDANMFAMEEGNIELVLGDSPSMYNAYQGIEMFDESIDVSLMAIGQTSFRPIVVQADSDIRTFEDLKGKTIIGIRPALFEFELITHGLMEAYGFEEGDIEIISTTETNETVDALRTGSVDAAVFPATAGNPFVTELIEDDVIRFLEIPDDKAEEVADMLPDAIYADAIEAGSFPDQDQDVNSFALATYFVSRGDIPEDTVYEITKTFFDNHEEFANVHGSAADWTLDNTIEGDPVIPFHPGAIQYFEEEGVWTEELQSIQDSLLN